MVSSRFEQEHRSLPPCEREWDELISDFPDDAADYSATELAEASDVAVTHMFR